jgi:hypothetical protein
MTKIHKKVVLPWAKVVQILEFQVGVIRSAIQAGQRATRVPYSGRM